MSDYAISAELRSVVGKKVKTLRANGITPAVIYGNGLDPIAIQLKEAELAAVFRAGGKNEQINVSVDGTTHTVVVQELQRHITRGDFIHVDFLTVA